MAQNDFGTINPNTKSGTDLASDLNDFRDAQNTNHSGSTQPSYVQTWMTWLDSTAANGVMKIYDGTDDVPVFVADATNNVARVALDNDEDTYIVSATDDTMTFVSSASTRMTLNASLLTMAVDIDMNGQGIRFDDATGIKDANNNEVMLFQTITSAVNYFDFSPSATGADLILAAAGNDTNIDLAITPKGSGSLVLDGLSWPNADGSADQILTTDGSGNLSFVDYDSGGLQSIQTFTASGTWTKPAGINNVLVFCTGGGGGAGGAGTSNTPGGGGGAGGTAIEFIDVSGTSSETVTIGAAGSGGAAASDGSAGGTSSFGSLCSATGGSGGAGGTATNDGAGGAGGVGSGGDLNVEGGDGGSAYGAGNTGGHGGSSFWGGGGRANPTAGGQGPTTGQAFGSGGGAHGTTGNSGAAGKAGVVLVLEFA